MTKQFLSSLTLLCAAGLSTAAASPVPTPEVWVVGTIHVNHLESRWGYSLQDLRTIIKAIQPDLACGEVYDRDNATDMEGYYPPENAVIEYAAKELGAEFFASDWRGSFYEGAAAMQAMTPEERHSFDHAHDELIAAIPFGSSTLMAFYHAPTTQAMVRRAHETRIAAGTEVADGFWYARNQQIVKRCMRRAAEIGAKRIAFTYGLEHKYIIEEYLDRLYKIRAREVPLPAYSDNSEMPEAIVTKWGVQAAGLRRILASSTASQEFKDMISNSSRISDLERCIATRGLSQDSRTR